MKNVFYLLMVLFTGIGFAQSPVIIDPTPLQLCDGNNDGYESFDLLSKNTEILGSLDPTQFSVSYHASFGGSLQNNNLLAIPFVNTTPNTQTIYVRVQNNSIPNSYATTTLELIVKQISINTSIPYYAIYENPFDGIANFDLTSRNSFITPNPNDQIMYFTSQGDAENLTNPIGNPDSFAGSHLQTIWFRVTDTITTCFKIGSYELKVFDSSVVVNIPDPIFKARLLASSTTNQVAGSGSNVWFAADANNDGEIQVSEALEITFLRLSGFVLSDSEKISSLEGINSFSNLIHLECHHNLLQTLNLGSLPNLFYLACSFNNLTSLNLQNFPNLEILYCGGNPLSSLNLQSLPNLKTLDCSATLLTSLDVTPFTNLNNLSCNNSQLNSLNVTGLSNLGGLQCDFNQLTTVNLQGLTSLGYLSATNNQINSLNLQQAPNLGNVILNNNLLTSISVEGLNFLNTLECNNNLFTTLSIESVTDYFQVFRCSENSLLETLFVKNGVDEFIWAANCPNLEYVCADESQIPSIQLGYAGLGNTDDYVLNSYCTFVPGGTYNSITGQIIMDANSNGCDTQDLAQPNIRIDINDGTNQGATFSSTTGNYGFYTQEGNFTITPNIENPNWFNFSPTSITVPFSDDENNTVTQNFCITPNGFHPDVEIILAPIFPARPGYQAMYQIVYKNKGNQTLSQVNGVSFTYNHNAMDFVSATTTPTITGPGILSWSYANLIPFESRSIYITFDVNTTTDVNPVNINDVLQFSTTILPVAGDETVADNTFMLDQIVVDSYVTNSITCIEGTEAASGVIGEYLHYVINFENTGTAAAQNIVIQLNIDENHFDINTLQSLYASHEVDARIQGNIAEFIFKNIVLESGGHGNILLKIKTWGQLDQTTTVSNKANIFVDYNYPILTNIATTTFSTLNNPDFKTDLSVVLYPNPVQEMFTVKADSELKTIEIFDVQGRILQTILCDQYNETIGIAQYAKGIYYVRIFTGNGMKTEKLIKN